MAIDGLADLRRQLDGLRRRAAPAMKAALLDAAGLIVKRQQSLAPVGRGKLRASIVASDGAAPKYASLTAGSRSRKAGDFVVISAGDSGVRYALLVQFGTKPHSLAEGAKRKGGKLQDRGPHHPGAKRRPFFFPGYRAERRAAKALIAREMRRATLDFVKGASGAYGLP